MIFHHSGNFSCSDVKTKSKVMIVSGGEMRIALSSKENKWNRTPMK